MYKYENLDNFRRRTHTIEVTIQSGEYKGNISITVGGNCFGLDILNTVNEDIIYDIADYKCAGCNIELIGKDDDGNGWFKYELTDDDGNTCEGEDLCKSFGRLVVGINIVTCELIDKVF